jgi:endonuclease-8
LDGRRLSGVEAYGKHLFYDVPGAGYLHVHLGLYGSFRDGEQPAPLAQGALRLRLQTDEVWADLRGATVVELLDAAQRQSVLDRLGPDPLARRPKPAGFLTRVERSKAPIAALLMDQSVLAGIGNVFRAEALFRQGMDPYRPGRDITEAELRALWDDLVKMLRAGLRTGRIVATLPRDRPRGSPVLPDNAHYVYRRAGLPCRRCQTEIRVAELVGRNLFWCPSCQAPR